METQWLYSFETETTRLLHCAHQVAVGFYRANNFFVLPYTTHTATGLTISFPDLNYLQIPGFWKKVANIDISHFPIDINPKLFAQTKKLLAVANLPAPIFQSTQTLWEKCQSEVIQEIYKLMPEKKCLIKKIIIHPTKFGSTCSFGVIEQEVGTVEMYLREDQGIITITEAILTSLTREDATELGGLWNESEILVDWLLTHSALTAVLEKYAKKSAFVPTLKGVRVKQQAKLMVQSENFYQKLGIPSQTKIFSLNGLIPEINHKPVESLSPQEKVVLRKLIQNTNQVVSIDELADLLFTREENFSLYALAKIIQRLREKLEANGISGSYIQTLRGQGYLLKN